MVEPLQELPVGKSQPIEAIAAPEPVLDDAAVRQAIMTAEANNQDPQSVTLDDFAQGSASKPVEVPQKFLKPDGAVDVEKIQASTKALDDAIQQKEVAATKSVDDYMREYNEKQTKFRNMPNPERLSVQSPPAQPLPQGELTSQQMEELVRKDYQADPLATTTRLFDLMLERRFAPIEEKEKIEATRSNVQKLAEKDPRILREDVFAAVNAKLNSDPDFWKLKNPHKAAWLEVKEEMRLGEPSVAQAQPSRPSPVLGGGTPPSAPSTSVGTPQNVIASLHTLDLRDKKQEALGDEAIRAQLAGLR